MYMPKLNAVAMVVLTLGVIAGAGVLVLHKAGPVGPEPVSIQKLLRNLSDRDPDVGREAEAAVRSLGIRAVPPLEEAAKSPDRVLADRARRLLAEMRPAPGPGATTVEACAPDHGDKMEMMEFVLESRGGQARAGDLGGLWVQFRNNGPAPVLVAHAPALDHPKMAVFEIEDEKGRTMAVAADVLHLKPTDIQEFVPVRPRDTALLFQGGRRLVEAVSRPGTYKIRFAYDATEGSDYRKITRASSDGALLPPIRLASNVVTVTVTE